MSFGQRYRESIIYKDVDVEESVDIRFHRPVAAVVTAALAPTPVTANQVTVSSLVVGLGGSFCLYQAFFGQLGPAWGIGQPGMLLAAGVLLFMAVILDCADGQLARFRGGGSRVGRILDGVVDVLVLLPAYVLLGIGIDDEFGTTWLLVSAVAGVTTWIRTMVYDKLKGVYLARTNPSGGEAAGIETLDDIRADYQKARADGSLLERVLLRIYLGFIIVRNRIASGDTDDATAGRSAAEIAAYRRAHRPTMRLASLLGLGTHMLLIYGSIALAAIDIDVLIWTQTLLASVFSILLIIVLIRSRSMQ